MEPVEGRQELEWVSAHSEELERYAGKWVALVGETIVGVGETASEALKEAQRKSPKTPLLLKVPRRDEGVYVLEWIWNSFTSGCAGRAGALIPPAEGDRPPPAR